MKWNLIGSAGRQLPQIQRGILTLCTLILLLVTLFGQPAAFARYEQRRTYQESPLSPVATPISASLPASLTTTLSATLTSPLTVTTPATVTTVFTSPLAAPPTTTLTTVITAPTTVATTVPVVATPAPTATLLNQGQISLVLVGAVLGGLLVVIAVVLSRQR